MNEELGLASQGVTAHKMTSLKDVVQMLLQGMEPEELVENGIPEEVVRAAMEMLMNQMGPQQEEQMPGLAGTNVKAI